MSAPTDGGPNVVALGGGHGLASTLRALRHYAASITAVASVADDGGSSGRLREAFAMPPPGDLRKCLVALADDPDSTWARAFEHRFDAGELDGHALGNLLIAGLAATTGDFLGALDEAARLVGARGRVLPATAAPVVLKASGPGGTEVEGQVAVAHARRVERVSIVPPDATPPAAVLEAIDRADQIVVGPGSLFTSVLAVAVVPAIRAALESTDAQTVYVCNLRPQAFETEGFDVAAHVAALVTHGVEPDMVVYDPARLPVGDLGGIPAVEADLALTGDDGHDPVKLAAVLRQLIG